MMEEIWKDIYFIQDGIEFDYRGLYQVSNYGNIKRLGNKKSRKERILKLHENKYGYLYIELYKNGERKNITVHRLVCHMFVDGYFDGAQIDHINTIKTDNRKENLHWVTTKENRNNPLTVEKCKGKGRKIIQYDLEGNLIKIWSCIVEAKRELGIRHISDCCQGRRKSAGGYIWRYYEED